MNISSLSLLSCNRQNDADTNLCRAEIIKVLFHILSTNQVTAPLFDIIRLCQRVYKSDSQLELQMKSALENGNSIQIICTYTIDITLMTAPIMAKVIIAPCGI